MFVDVSDDISSDPSHVLLIREPRVAKPTLLKQRKQHVL
jgi:hypothetical protein